MIRRLILAALVLGELAIAEPRHIPQDTKPLPADWFHGFDRTLINGRPVQPNELNALVQVRSGLGSCSGNITGSNTVITAAHCMRNRDTVRITTDNGLRTQATCYTSSEEQDIAVCVTRQPLQLKFVSLATPEEFDYVEVGEISTLAGKGCTKDDGTGGNDGITRVGESRINELKIDSYYFSTRGNEAQGCFGDSGGAIFVRVGDFFSERQILLGILSAVSVDRNDRITDTTYFVDLTMDVNRAFIEKIADDQALQVCGLNISCINGRDPGDENDDGDCSEELAGFKASKAAFDKSADALTQCLEQ